MHPLCTQHSRIYRIASYTFTLALISISFLIAGSLQNPDNARAFSNATVGGCPLFPSDNIWNHDISTLPVHRNSANFIASIGLTSHVHADFGAGLYDGAPIGIPYIVVPGSQPYVPVSFNYADESNPGPYPIPSNAPIEGGSQSSGDRHVIVVDSGACRLYEMYASYPQSNGSWKAGSGAVWSLNSDALRPSTWTSADAAGLPILPGLVRYDDIASGVINHALRFTVNSTQSAFLWPAHHYASSSTNPNLPPMGLRLRLKANVNISSFSRTNQIILTALKRYGMIVADNGSSWYISGAPDSRWNNNDLHMLGTIPGSDFEAVDESSLQVNVNSGQSAGSSPIVSTPPATHTPIATTTGTHSRASAMTPETAELINRSSKNVITNTNTQNTSASGGSHYMLPILLGSMIVLLTIIIAGSRLLWAKRSRK
ncbi:MAG TPA: hypothetical protein VIX20_12895 [Ktedonobacteraceae bacterium]